MSGTLPLTGERTAPGIPSENYWFQRHVAAYRFAASQVEGTVVDAGCGEGYGSAILGARGAKVVSLDLDEPTLRHAMARYPASALAKGDLHRLPLADSSVDAIVALQVIEHLPDAAAFIREAARTLRPGGALVLSTPNRATFPSGLNPFHTNEYEARELQELLTGFEEEVRLMGMAHGPYIRWLERVLGEPIQEVLVGTPFEQLPPGLRAMLRLVSPKSFIVVAEPEGSLDLLAVCRKAEEESEGSAAKKVV